MTFSWKSRGGGADRVNPPKPLHSGGSAEDALIARKVRRAKRALLFERIWPRIWLPIGIAGLFVLLSALEVWAMLPPQLHFVLLWTLAGAFILSLLPLVWWRRVSNETAIERIERNSPEDHRPLTAYRDRIAAGGTSPETEALWRAHQAQAAAKLRRLQVGAARPKTERFDPLALRAALVLLLAVVFFWQGSEIGPRLALAFKVPDFADINAQRIDAWITPPAYTHLDPILLANGALNGKDAGQIMVPEGSTLSVRISGDDATRYDVALNKSEKGTMVLTPGPQSNESFAEYSAKIEKSGELRIHRFYGRDRVWQLNVVPDQKPKIAFNGPIEVTDRGAIHLRYKVEDDYGVVSAEARVERVAPANPEAFLIGKPPIFALPLPRAPIKSGEARTYKDLTAHPWAGLPVTITLVAKDEAGHEGQSPVRGIILPERQFTKFLAKAIVEQRKLLVEAPSRATVVAGSLEALASTANEDELQPASYLQLRSASWKLRHAPDLGSVEEVVDQLWEAAVKIEEGNMSQAERELRAAQERLKEALEKGASPAEIQKLMTELRSALNKYLQAMASQQRSGKGEKMQASKGAKTVTPQDLKQLLDKIENLAKSGSQAAAEQMLNQLRDILESLQAANSSEQGGEGGSAEGMQQLGKLSDLMRNQQQLLDETFRAQQQGEEAETRGLDEDGDANAEAQQQNGDKDGGTSGKGHAQALQQKQDQIYKDLQELMPQLKNGQGDALARKFDNAAKAMDRASRALGENDLGQASEMEAQALENIRQGARALAERMMEAQRGGRESGQTGRDPLGRRQSDTLQGLDGGEEVKIDEFTVQRAREIMDELRRRLGDSKRPALELDYLQRLIKPF